MIKDRPRRLDRIFSRTPLYFITFCARDRQKIHDLHRLAAGFRDYCTRAAGKHNVAVGRYVIMPDHIHLFVRGGLDFTLGRWVGALKQALAKVPALWRPKTQIWQEGFFDHVLRSDESYSEKWNYVRENPARAGFVHSAADWPYQGEIVYIDRA